jgi:DnaJ-domain-containing protein 1
MFRAPHSRDQMDQSHWFCLEHARAYNATWDFFAGMSPEEIERFRREDTTGHRPTWPLGVGPFNSPRFIVDAFQLFSQSDGNRTNSGRLLHPKEQRALSKLDLHPESTLEEIKRRYKELAKRYHPDLHGGDKTSEELLKDVNEAYDYLMTCGFG